MLHSSRGGALTRPPMRRQPPIQSRSTRQKLPRHCEEGKARRGNPVDNGLFGKRRDCHVASLLAMAEVDVGWSFCFSAFIIVPGRRGQCHTPYSPISIRRAETSDRSGGFTRLPPSTTYQSRVWFPALPGVHRLFTGKSELCVAWFGNL